MARWCAPFTLIGMLEGYHWQMDKHGMISDTLVHDADITSVIGESDFLHHSKCTLSTVILLPYLHQCWLSMERDVVCNTPSMVVSLVTRHSYDSRPCHFAHTHHNVCSLLRATEWYECIMHITCFHHVVTPLVSINQPW